LRIRNSRPEDAEAIAALLAAGWRAAYRGIIDQERLDHLGVKQWARDIRANLEKLTAGSLSLVAELDELEGRLAGSCFVVVPARDGDLGAESAELAAIYVEPSMWRRGIGTELFARARDHCTAQGHSQMTLWTFEGNQRAIDFYESLGWHRDGSRQIHPGAKVPAVRMRFTIRPR
jgi:GNAT superfamily N-acetyltransferase